MPARAACGNLVSKTEKTKDVTQWWDLLHTHRALCWALWRRKQNNKLVLAQSSHTEFWAFLPDLCLQPSPVCVMPGFRLLRQTPWRIFILPLPPTSVQSTLRPRRPVLSAHPKPTVSFEFLFETGWLQTCCVAKDDLGLQSRRLCLWSAGIASVHPHTRFVWC